MPPTDSTAVISDADIDAIYDGLIGLSVNHVVPISHRLALRAVFERGMEHGELKARRAGDAAGKGRIIFLHQKPRRVFFLVDHIGAVHNNPDAIGSLVAVAGVNVPVDEEPDEILKMLMR